MDLPEGDQSAEENNEIEQYASRLSLFTSQYGREGIMSYNMDNIIGPPSNPGCFGDFASSAVLATYGTWWQRCPSARVTCSSSAPPHPLAQDFIDVEFAESVYVLEVLLFETHHRGALAGVLARWQQADGTPRWYRLWRRPSSEPSSRRALTLSPTRPQLNILLRPIRHIRLEFDSSTLPYYAGLDAVKLRGTRHLPPTRVLLRADAACGPVLSRLRDLCWTHQLPALTECAVEDRLRMLTTLAEFWMEWQHSRSRREKRRTAEKQRLSLLQMPEEILLRVLSMLDLVSLSRAAMTCRHLHRLSTDHSLYSHIDLQPYWHLVDARVCSFLASRAASLTHLDLSWCGSHGALPVTLFCNLLAEIGDRLLCLRVDACDWFNGLCLEWAGLFCRGLEELSLRSCTGICDEAFWSLQYLCCLRRLDLYRTAVTAAPLAAFIANASGLQHLGLGLCSRLQRLWQVCEALGQCCPDLRSLCLWKLTELPWTELRHLRHCNRLQELDIGWCRAAVTEAELPFLRNLVPHTPDLSKLFLTSLRMIQDGDLELIAQNCPRMQQLDILGASLVHPEAVQSVLSSCHQLEMLDVSFCAMISQEQVERWRLVFPHVTILKSSERVR